MLILTHRKLGVVNADLDHWQDHVREQIEQGTNFLLIISKNPNDVKQFCNLFGLPDDCTPRTISQGEFFLMSQYVEPEAFDTVLHHWDERHQVVFVEQIDFPMNRPPRMRNFLVYSPVLGILAQHERLNGAKEMLQDYNDHSTPGVPQPEAGVYSWEHRRNVPHCSAARIEDWVASLLQFDSEHPGKSQFGCVLVEAFVLRLIDSVAQQHAIPSCIVGTQR